MRKIEVNKKQKSLKKRLKTFSHRGKVLERHPATCYFDEHTSLIPQERYTFDYVSNE